MSKTLWIASLALSGCVVTTPHAVSGPSGGGGGGSPASYGDLPDPTQPMPQGSVGTNAQLQLEQPATVKVDARADIYSAEAKAPNPDRGGVMPSLLTLAPGGTYITFSNVHGKTGCDSGTPAADPDGGNCAGGNTDLTSADAASGIKDHQHSQFLVGVFLGAEAVPLPEAADFTGHEDFIALNPGIGQTFFIGDGLTGNGNGDTQRFDIPPGAVHLWLGIADGYSFQGAPGAYGDNTGGIAATATEHK